MIWLFLPASLVLAWAVYALIPTLWHKRRKYPGPELPGRKYLCLTFDDGPDPEHDAPLLELLSAHQARATFFVLGEKAQKAPQVLAAMGELGHEVELHALAHESALLQSPRATKKALAQSEALLASQGIRINFFRPPWGHLNLSQLRFSRGRGWKMVLWSVMAGDWQPQLTPEELAQRLLTQAKNGSIICLHDAGEDPEAPSRMITALSQALPVWRSRGYEFITVKEMVGK